VASQQSRKRGERGERLHWQAIVFAHIRSVSAPAYGMVPSTLRVGVPPLVNSLWRSPHRHTQRYTLLT
jgi:hypothetical protein